MSDTKRRALYGARAHAGETGILPSAFPRPIGPNAMKYLQEVVDSGLTVGIGTDGSASNNDVDMFGEMDTVAKIHKVARMDPTAMDARTTARAATMGGAGCLGMEKEIGSLEKGKKADLIVLDLDQPHLTPVYNPVSHLVYAARGSDVVHSMVAGRWLMREQKIRTLDEEGILAEVTSLARQIQAM